MFHELLAFALLGTTLASIDHFSWQDCDSDADRPIKFSSIEISPFPVVLPGPLTFSASANFTKAVDVGKLELELKRHVPILGYVHVPCVLGIGSCDVDLCTEIGRLSSTSFGREIQQIINDNHVKATCPIQAQSVSASHATIHIPDPGTLASVIAAGDYSITATIKDKSNNVAGCLSMKVQLKREHHGFLFR